MELGTTVSLFVVALYVGGIFIASLSLFLAAKIVGVAVSFPQAIAVNIITVVLTFFPYGKILALIGFFVSLKLFVKAGIGELFILLVLQVIVFFAIFKLINIIM